MDLKEIFEHKIKIESKVKTIDALFLNEDRVQHTNYHPYYQRNYVWDEEKASYFIESIFLGTEIPPLIFFVNEDDYEVIDGRQRYETITRFLHGKMNLRKTALKKLSNVKGLAGKNYNNLSQEFKDMFLDTKIRTMEFKFLAEDHTKEDEEHVKREIFQRYNSGITPLNQQQIDKAVYYDDDITKCFEDHFNSDMRTYDMVNSLFGFEKNNMEKLMRKIRELLVLRNIPIRYFAIQKERIVSRFFEYLSENTENAEEVYNSFILIVNLVDMLSQGLQRTGIKVNRLIAECLYWALSIVREEKNGDLTDVTDKTIIELSPFIKENLLAYNMVRSSFSFELNNRYEITASFFSRYCNVDFDIYLKNSQTFKNEKKKLGEITETKDLTFEELRINKPEPTSFEIGDICRQMSRQKFLLRPPYQRSEVIDKKKASAIIESLLLGIKLPPIFVFKHTNGISEVVDGQQRLLAILGFMGQTYKDEKGEDCQSRKNEYRLQLKQGILSDLDGKKYSDLSSADQKKIRYADLWVIEINEKINPQFDAIDLFVRLNNKPYPIKKDTFEMWNSFVSRDIIETIKNIFEKNASWFYLRKNNSRMENENLITTLAYFSYMESKNGIGNDGLCPEKTIDLYSIGGRISCRMKSKYDITKVLEGDDDYDLSHQRFIMEANILDFNFIANLKFLCSFGGKSAKEALDDMVAGTSGRRTAQNLYILWLLLRNVKFDAIKDRASTVNKKINKIIKMMSQDGDINKFRKEILEFRNEYYKRDENFHSSIYTYLRDICLITRKKENNTSYVIYPTEDSWGFSLKSSSNTTIADKISNFLYICNIRKGFLNGFLFSILISSYCKHLIDKNGGLKVATLGDIRIPYSDNRIQVIFNKIYSYLNACTQNVKIYEFYGRIIDVMVEQLYMEEQFSQANINLIEDIGMLEDLPSDIQAASVKAEELYLKLNDANSPIKTSLLKAIPIEKDYSLQ